MDSLFDLNKQYTCIYIAIVKSLKYPQVHSQIIGYLNFSWGMPPKSPSISMLCMLIVHCTIIGQLATACVPSSLKQFPPALHVVGLWVASLVNLCTYVCIYSCAHDQELAEFQQALLDQSRPRDVNRIARTGQSTNNLAIQRAANHSPGAAEEQYYLWCMQTHIHKGL